VSGQTLDRRMVAHVAAMAQCREEISYSLRDVQVVAERWRIHYNPGSSHTSLGYRRPAPKRGRLKPEVW
jgi:hypothetical protein